VSDSAAIPSHHVASAFSLEEMPLTLCFRHTVVKMDLAKAS